jgi:hypothetical protein
MQADHIYHVSADHDDPKYRAQDKLVLVKEVGRTFVAEAKPYGSSQPFGTAEEAVNKLLRNSGCTNIRIVWSPVP